MQVGLGNVLDTTPAHGVSCEAFDRLDDRVAAACGRIERGRAAGGHGYESLNLPSTIDLAAVRDAVSRFDNPSAIVTVSIGGSTLGATILIDVLEGNADAHYLDNVDPEVVERLLNSLDFASTVANVVSWSGTAAETLANFLVVREAMAGAGVDWTDRTFVTTDEGGDPRDPADRHDLPSLPAPDGVPGQFSVFSTIGLATAALCGHDIEAVSEGVVVQEVRLSDSFFDSPAYTYDAVPYTLAEHGMQQGAMMPYVGSLETFSEWFTQPWVEPLGKDGLSQTPLWAFGATDQHSQFQLYRAGPRDELMTFIHATECEDVATPETDLDGLTYPGGPSLGDLLDTEFGATGASLATVGRPSVRIEFDCVGGYGLGELLHTMEAACVLYGGLASVDTFVQPTAEWGKRIAHSLLDGGGFEEADAVEEKSRLVVE